MTLTYRTSYTGNLVAAYQGACRVGYVHRGAPGRGWLWSMSLVRPEGGVYLGREPTLEDAQRALEACAAAWIVAAGLSVFGPDEKGPLATAKKKVATKSKKVLGRPKKNE